MHESCLSILSLAILVAVPPAIQAQKAGADTSAAAKDVETAADPPEAPRNVSVEEVVEDNQIDRRLREILQSTEWFQSESVRVANGVVFLSGTTSNERYRRWAGDLASQTEDVVAVVNRISVREPPILHLDPAFQAAGGMMRSTVRALPLIALSLIMLVATWLAARGAQKVADWTFLPRIETRLLREVSRKALVIPIGVLGAFLVLKVTGLSQLAITVLGGTGLFGLVIGIAFRDIAENFLSSILLSVQNPFRYGDLIEVAGHLGFVQRVNTRGTLLMTFDGNHIQVPNAQVYQGTITNYTSNPNRRFSFTIGIGYDASATEAQNTAMAVLRDHPAILNEPEPQVLVEQLASSTIKLTVYAWVNAEQHSWVKVKSSVMRLTLRAFEYAGLSMPDDQREIVFPAGVPVQMLEATSLGRQPPAETSQCDFDNSSVREPVRNNAEGDFSSEAVELRAQARRSRDPDEVDIDLLSKPTGRTASSEKVVSS